jgi:RNA 2',3'-cyclic 3'-phosphodiesterase
MPEPERAVAELEFPLPTDPETLAERLTVLAARLAAVPSHPPVLLESLWNPVPRLRLVGLALGLAEPAEEEERRAPPIAPWIGMPPEAWRRSSAFLLLGAGEADRAAPGPFAIRDPRTLPESLRAASFVEPPIGPAAPRWAAAQIHWAPAPHGRLRAAARLWLVAPEAAPGPASWSGPIADRVARLGFDAVLERRGYDRRAAREWSSGAWHRVRPRARLVLRPAEAARLALLGGVPPRRPPAAASSHTVVFGASGSGKSAFVVAAVRARLRAGRPAVLFDVHGDLGPRVVAGAGPEELARLVAIDATGPAPVPGVRILGGGAITAEAERAHALAALRRLGAEEGGVYWGFRLDRVFDTMLRLAQEEGGDLRDVYELLVDPARRDLARARTRSALAARFLDELPAILRRNPEFLWPAAARLHRIVFDERLAELVAPRGLPLAADERLERGEVLLWRLPFGLFGPEGVALATSLLATHLYLRRVERATTSGAAPTEVLFALDEAQLISPRLVTEMLGEGRKFGVALLVASQFPERLATELRAAAAGAAGTHVLFRIPRPQTSDLARWVGLPVREAEQLATLPDGVALRSASAPGGRRERVEVPPGPTPDPGAWAERVATTHAPFRPDVAEEDPELPFAVERLLLELLAREAHRGPVASPPNGGTVSGPEADPALASAVRRGEVADDGAGGFRLTVRGYHRLGYSTHTGAIRESAEHRRLLLDCFRLFARHGHRLEIVRQGRFDLRLPDARLVWLDGAERALPPSELARRIARDRTSWAWRAFGGRDIHVEAEVSGADRPDRLRHDLAKGRRAGACVLFAVGTPARSRRVRAVLREAGASSSEARVWLLRAPAAPAEEESSSPPPPSPGPPMRAFVALEIPPLDPGVAWPRPPERHLTLAFLGAIDDGGARAAQRAIERVASRWAPFAITFRGAGAFPDPARPRVGWVGVGEGTAELVGLAGALRRALEEEGLPTASRPFAPHVTVLRVRSREDAEAVRRLLAEVGARSVGAARVDAMVLIASRLGPGGAVHTPLRRVPLTGTGPAPSPGPSA